MGGWQGGGGGVLGPQLGTDASTKGRRKDPIWCSQNFCERNPLHHFLGSKTNFDISLAAHIPGTSKTLIGIKM